MSQQNNKNVIIGKILEAFFLAGKETDPEKSQQIMHDAVEEIDAIDPTFSRRFNEGLLHVLLSEDETEPDESEQDLEAELEEAYDSYLQRLVAEGEDAQQALEDAGETELLEAIDQWADVLSRPIDDLENVVSDDDMDAGLAIMDRHRDRKIEETRQHIADEFGDDEPTEETDV